MGEKDILEKKLVDYADVFADILNVMAFHGASVIPPEQLIDSLPHSTYKAGGKIHFQERDCAKFWNMQKLRLALLGLENQTEEEADMVLRVIGYDGASYREQLNRGVRGKKQVRYPVVTFVLYFGFEKPWTKARTLRETLSVPEVLEPYFTDYRIHVLEVAWLADEMYDMFQSDFRYVADYFRQMRRNRHYEPPEGMVAHVKEFFDLMAVLTNDSRWENVYNDRKDIDHTAGGEGSLKSYISVMYEKALAEGEAIGEARGKAIGEARGEARGTAQGLIQGEKRLAELVLRLLEEGKQEEARLVLQDGKARERYYALYGL